MKQECASRRFGIFDQIFEENERMTLFTLLKKGAGEPEFHRQTVRKLRDAFAKFFLRLIRMAVSQEHLTKMQAQCGIVGRGPESFSQCVDSFIPRGVRITSVV